VLKQHRLPTILPQARARRLAISDTERFTVAMTSYSAEYAQLKFLYFPSSRSAVSDKSYIDQALASLRLDH
jgi:hypothetical protein